MALQLQEQQRDILDITDTGVSRSLQCQAEAIHTSNGFAGLKLQQHPALQHVRKPFSSGSKIKTLAT